MNGTPDSMTQPEWENDRRIRFHGDGGPTVIALHGGPGACGGAVRLARGLSDDFQVIEPWQRTSGAVPLSVAVHIDDIRQLIRSRCKGKKPVVIGESWGAMLALSYAAKHPDTIEGIALVGCGAFEEDSRDAGVQVREQRILDYIEKHPEHKADLELDLGEQIMKWHEMTDAFEPLPYENEASEPFDMKGHTETWEDMVRCQRENIYPQSFSSVISPVIMLHGKQDPHPGKVIRDSLKEFIPQLEYHELERCGHDPVVEKYAREEFFAVLKGWLSNTIGERKRA
jgi:pimeloyl-ACP methyl ester carboxylesterase